MGGKDGRCVGLTTLPPSCVECLEIWEPQPNRTVQGLLYVYILGKEIVFRVNSSSLYSQQYVIGPHPEPDEVCVFYIHFNITLLCVSLFEIEDYTASRRRRQAC